MNIEVFQYIEINSIGIVILLILLFYIVFVYKEVDGVHERPFLGLLICNVALLASDCGMHFLRGNSEKSFIYLAYVLGCIYCILHPVFGSIWYWYTFKKLFPEKKIGIKRKIVVIVPTVICSIFVFASPVTHLLFFMDRNNQFVRGKYFYLVVACTVLYWMLSAVLAIKEFIIEKRIREKNIYLSLILFPVPTLLGNMVQLKYNGITLVWVCAAVSSLILFMNIQGYQLSHDTMTGVFNRAQARKQLKWELKNFTRNRDCLFVAMIDLDRFKEINDKFGHAVGDKALIMTAQILVNSCREKDFVARIGGDEFLLLGHRKNEDEVRKILSDIENNIHVSNESNQHPFMLSLSIGYELYCKKDGRSVDTIISSADSKMYAQKRSKGEVRNRETIQSL